MLLNKYAINTQNYTPDSIIYKIKQYSVTLRL